MSNPNGTKHGVILSGGGANGAYEIGVLKALFAGKSEATQGESLDPDVFVGTSVGAYNAAFLVSRWDVYGTAAIASLEQTWLDHVSSSRQKPLNGVFRIRNSPREFLDPTNLLLNPLQPFEHLLNDNAFLAWDGLQRLVNLVTPRETPLLERIVELFDFSSFISLEPFRQTVKDTVWLPELRRSQKELRIIATNWEMGSVEIYSKYDMTDQLGPLIILGSSAIPGIFPPTSVGSQQFVDGGLLLNSPLAPAIDAGANVLHVISLFPEVEKIPLATMNNMVATVLRQQIISWTKALDANLRRAENINETVKFLALTSEAIQKLYAGNPDAGLLANLRLEEINQSIEQYQQNHILVTVHRYYPEDDISRPLGLLDFDCERIKALIERGFDDAVRHNCQENKCVLL